MIYLFWLLTALISPHVLANSSVPAITNLGDIAARLKLKRFEGMQFTNHIKVAVLDNGFYGYESEIGSTLPAKTIFHNGPAIADEKPMTSPHGLLMAELMTQIIQKAIPRADFELHLFNTWGYTKFVDAVDTVVKERFDVVLYAQVWEWGGNGDSKGYIDTVVQRALDAKIVWINASGDFGATTLIAPIESREQKGESWVIFKDEKGRTSDSVGFSCRAIPKCRLRATLTWNSFADDPETGTDKDLDLYLYRKGSLEPIAKSENVQMMKVANENETILPREVIDTGEDGKALMVDGGKNVGDYLIRVKNKSKNFDPSRDRLKILLSGNDLILNNASLGETLLPPADLPGVIAVGASDDPTTSQSAKMKKPEIMFRSEADLSGGSFVHGTSTASAMAAGLAVVELGIGLAHDQVLGGLKAVSDGSPTKMAAAPPYEPKETQSAAVLDPPSEYATSAGHECYERSALPESVQSAAGPWITSGGHAIIDDNGRVAVVIPLQEMSHLSVPRGERAFVNPKGMTYLTSRSVLAGLPADTYEIFVSDRPLCPSGS